MSTTQLTWCILLLPARLWVESVSVPFELPASPCIVQKVPFLFLFLQTPTVQSLQAKGRFHRAHFLILGDCCDFFSRRCQLAKNNPPTTSTQSWTIPGDKISLCQQSVPTFCKISLLFVQALDVSGLVLRDQWNHPGVALLNISAVLFQFVLIWFTESMEKLIGGGIEKLIVLLF